MLATQKWKMQESGCPCFQGPWPVSPSPGRNPLLTCGFVTLLKSGSRIMVTVLRVIHLFFMYMKTLLKEKWAHRLACGALGPWGRCVTKTAVRRSSSPEEAEAWGHRGLGPESRDPFLHPLLPALCSGWRMRAVIARRERCIPLVLCSDNNTSHFRTVLAATLETRSIAVCKERPFGFSWAGDRLCLLTFGGP